MTRRRKWFLGGLAALGLLGVLALPGVHWRLVGWCRGELFYRGRPASYWAEELRSLNLYLVVRGADPDEPGALAWQGWPQPKPFTPAWVKMKSGFAYPVRQVGEDDLPFASPDPGAAPVLRALSADPHEGVSGWAKEALGRIDPDAPKEAPDRP